MTYDAKEISLYGGGPIELYLFDRESTQLWAYTSADEEQTYLGQVYVSVPIKRGKIEHSQDIVRNAITLSLPTSTDFVQEYIASPPTDQITLTIHRFHYGDSEVKSIWVGRVINVSFKEISADVRCESIHASLKRFTLRRRYQVACPHLLYSDSCGASSASFKVTTTLSDVDGLIITSSDFGSYADGYFTGGYVTILSGGVYNKRFITDHVGNDLTLNLALTDAVVGSSVEAYPGCAHNITDCQTKFSNILNYGGQPWIPKTHNPMAGSPIF